MSDTLDLNEDQLKKGSTIKKNMNSILKIQKNSIKPLLISVKKKAIYAKYKKEAFSPF